MPNEMEYTFHLGFVAFQTNENDPVPTIDETSHQLVPVQQPPPVQQPGGTSNAEIPKVYTKLLKLTEFDTFVATHGPGTDVDGKHTFFLLFSN